MSERTQTTLRRLMWPIIQILSLIVLVLSFIYGIASFFSQNKNAPIWPFALAIMALVVLIITPKIANAQEISNLARPTIEVAESGPSHYVNNESHIRTLPFCGASHCNYRIEVSNRRDSRVLMAFWADSPFVTVLNPRCVVIEKTSDFAGIGDLSMAEGPVVDMVLCKNKHNVYYENTVLVPDFFNTRLRKILPIINDGSGRERKVAIVEALIIRELFYRAGTTPRNLAKLNEAIKFAAAKEQLNIESIVDEIIQRCDKRLKLRTGN